MISAPFIEYLKKGTFTFLGTLLAVYLFIILLTYTGNDPSWSHISSDMTTINNMGGSTGAWLSDLFYSFFGFGAWWLLIFLVYESILIWWDNKPTFWPLRVVAYVFLLLSSSALFAQLVALVQQVANPLVTGLEGVAGGIIGLELQARLAQLLTQWGSVLFLLVFVVITTTFAFNIHWQALYHKLVDLSWFGSGVKAEATDTEQYAKDDNDEALENNEAVLTEGLISKKSKKAKPDYGQLPLELQPAHSEQTNHGQASISDTERFGDVLTDFLIKSGLGASVKATLATEAATNQNAMSDSLSTPTSTLKHNNIDAASARKVEPSFAWNNTDVIDDLLAAAPNSSNDDQKAIPALARAPHTTDANDFEAPTSEPEFFETKESESEMVASQILEPEKSEQETADHTDTALNDKSDEAITPEVAELADTWLDAYQSIAAESEEPWQPEPQESALTSVTDQSVSLSSDNQHVEVQAATVSDTATNKRVSEVQTSIPAAPAADMTPTNTPPANPKAAPTIETAELNTATKPVAAAKSTMSFAVPEGDSSNLITDMMPDDDADDEIATSVMPDISDDAAFSQKSRSMQTAAYRSSLTPIPEVSILDKPDPDRKPSYTMAELEQLSELLEIKLQEFNVKATVVNAIPGPVVTRFEVELAAGVKASKVTGISRDLARSLSMASLRVVEVIPGKPYIGIEVPNKQREMVRLIELLNTDKYKDPKAQISMAMGKDIGGNPIITDLARAPHMLVAGTTGSGKSVLVNSMLLSMLLKYTPNELRLILIDPKQLELANYNDIPHLLTPVVTDMTEAASSLSWCVAEMERRYQLMSLLKVRKLNEFNKKVRAAEKAGKPMLDPLWRPNDNVSIEQAPKLKTLPMIVIVADEFADMIMQVGKQAEELITRLAQKSRAAGIHLMLATQRPSVDVITGLIKANIPVRAALRVNSKVDSRTILDSGGAEDMLGNGDMLFLGPGQIEPDRVHGAYVSDEEVNRVCDAWRERGAPDYIDNMAGNFELSSPSGGGSANASGEDDDLYNDAVAFIMETRKVSASSIQRKFSIGYNRAARIVDSMEEAGLVSSMGKSGKRELLM
ncbi:DNA translocase FtsK 4TM domain-containing protein [uncultured Psychrobacter sp.]|uniref:DNA translocase FtsK 4TM domain-containing protein n=1 Tax=uncultured Psychrobacter sp. TaxID=259303 RepID=UPI003457C053